MTDLSLSFEEFLMASGDTKSVELLNGLTLSKEIPEIAHDHLWAQLKHYFVVGGMPEAVATYCEYKNDIFTAFSKVRESQEQLVTAYYADVAKHSGKVNAMHIDRVFRSIPAQLEMSMEETSKKFKFKGVIPGLNHPMDKSRGWFR